VDVALTRHVSARAFEVNWLRTELPNGKTNIQNNLQFGAGLVFRIGKR